MPRKQKKLNISDKKQSTGPVECLGMTFEGDEARRAHFTRLLQEKLQDPEFRKTPGFPKGSDEDILRMSDPPYYTACPNPFMADMIEAHNSSRTIRADYKRLPLTVDVREGKYDPLYRSHPYHTKVPHLAIVPSILHYTMPGDVVLDGFAGSGMTGVAVQFCGSRSRSGLLGAGRLDRSEGSTGNTGTSGSRKVILNDLSPAATHIAANLNLSIDFEALRNAYSAILQTVRARYSWVYEACPQGSSDAGEVTCTVWSEVFRCNECTSEVVFLNAALDRDTGKVSKAIECPNCGATATKEQMELVTELTWDHVDGKPRQQPRRVPFMIEYADGEGTRHSRLPTAADLQLLERIHELPWPDLLPTVAFPDCQMRRVGRMKTTGVTRIDDLYLKRSAIVISAFWKEATSWPEPRISSALRNMVDQCFSTASVLNRYRPASSFGNGPLRGVYYVPSQIAEASVFHLMDGIAKRIERSARRFGYREPGGAWISTGDCANLPIPDRSVDYVFTDPPFGENIYYGDLNLLVESWFGVFTSTEEEAIVDRVRGKAVVDYQRLMRASFAEYHRILRPGRWLTVVFSNSKNAIWRAIQEALGAAGFVVADVRTLDKKHGSFKQVTSSAVKQDLVISAYKPTVALVEKFELGEGTADSAWAFIREHLRNVPVFADRGGDIEVVAERTAQTLHDRMIAFFVQRGVSVPLSGPEFFEGLDQRFARRDGMYFLPDQVTKYDKKRALGGNIRQLSLFVMDEASAIRWLRQVLDHKPQSFQDLQPQFMKAAGSWAKHESTVELKDLLRENFLHYDGTGEVPAPIHSYLSTNHKMRNLDKSNPDLRAKGKDRWYVPSVHRQGDLDQLRVRALLKEFEEYKQSTQRKIKQFRTEAVRAGFKAAYDARDYKTIVDVADRLPEKVIQEDEKLLMYLDVALMRYEKAEQPSLFPGS